MNFWPTSWWWLWYIISILCCMIAICIAVASGYIVQKWAQNIVFDWGVKRFHLKEFKKRWKIFRCDRCGKKDTQYFMFHLALWRCSSCEKETLGEIPKEPRRRKRHH